jgi:uncharacterized protein YndB with AHSA1/START domain
MNIRAKVDTQSIHAEYELAHAPSSVWRALTESRLLSAWLMANDIRPMVGHRFTFSTQPMLGWDGIVHCQILEVHRQRLLRYSWRSGAECSILESVVTWTLTPTPRGTRLALELSGFVPRETFAFVAMCKGWRGKMADRLREVLTLADTE